MQGPGVEGRGRKGTSAGTWRPWASARSQRCAPASASPVGGGRRTGAPARLGEVTRAKLLSLKKLRTASFWQIFFFSRLSFMFYFSSFLLVEFYRPSGPDAFPGGARQAVSRTAVVSQGLYLQDPGWLRGPRTELTSPGPRVAVRCRSL